MNNTNNYEDRNSPPRELEVSEQFTIKELTS